MPWILNILYLAALALASPVLLYRVIARGKYRDGWGQKFLGHLPKQTQADDLSSPRRRIWFHAVSVGEVLQLEPVVAALEQQHPNVDVVVTTTTVTGLSVAREKFPQHIVCYFPLDFSWAVHNAVERIRPDVVVLVELELWPNFVREVARRNIPLLLINGRISERSFRGYRKLRFLMRRVLSRFDCLAVQNETYAERLRDLGAPPERVTVTGSVKFDRIQPDRDNSGTRELGESFGLTAAETVFIAGSTHAPEEDIALNAWTELRGEFPDLRLILVPRHKERFEEVARLVTSRGLPLLRRSDAHETHSSSFILHPSSLLPPVLLLDTLGELSACWGLADVAFVGGSLTRRGGQNMIEPAGFGAAVLFGPNTRNFRDVVEMLLDENAARVVDDESQLVATLRELLLDSTQRAHLGGNAQRVVAAQRGATARTVELIRAVLPPDRKTMSPAA